MTTSVETKNPALAALLSFFIPGLGQIYNGQTKRGLIILAVQFVNLVLVSVGIGLVTGAAVWLWGMYDAYRGAQASGVATGGATPVQVGGETAPASATPIVGQEWASGSVPPPAGETAAAGAAPILAAPRLTNKQAEALLRDLARANDAEAERLQTALAQGGPEAYKQIVEKQPQWEQAAARSRPDSREAQALARLKAARSRYEQNAPVADLLVLYEEGLTLFEPDLRESVRSSVSRWAEVQMRRQGAAILPQMMTLLDSKHDAVRFHAIALLGDFDDAGVARKFARMAQIDSSANCRFQALTALTGRLTPEVTSDLVAAMVSEVQRSHEEQVVQRVAAATRLGLELLSGGPGGLVGSFGGMVMGRGASWMTGPMRSSVAKLQPLQRLTVFAEAYLVVLGSADHFPTADLSALFEHGDPHVRQFMYATWSYRCLTAPDEAQRQHFIALALAAAHGPDQRTRDAAIAALVVCDRRMGYAPATKAVEQLLQSRNSDVAQRTRQIVKETERRASK